MQFSITAAAAKQIHAVLTERGGGLALRIHIRKAGAGEKWLMALEPGHMTTATVDGVPVVVDSVTEKYLDGMVIDWVHTPEGDGFGVYERDLRDMKMLPR